MSVIPYLSPIAPDDTAGFFNVVGSATKSNVLEAVALNAAAGLRTVEFQIPSNAEDLLLGCQLTRIAATDVSFDPSGSLDGTNYNEWTSRSVAAGAGTLKEYSESLTVSADKNFLTSFDVRGLKKFKVIIAGTSGGATDLLTMQASVTLKK